MNVLVYAGPGTTIESVKYAADTLRRTLSPYYGVINVGASTLRDEPWQTSTALLAFPGGADLPMCRELNGKAMEKIKKYVRNGGRFIGFCAGGYFGSEKIEFEVGTACEVSGTRELGFFPGICRGCAFSGFQYNSNIGMQATRLSIEPYLDLKAPEQPFYAYYNGGGMFVDAAKYPEVEILSKYLDKTTVEDPSGDYAAVVYCKVGKGHAILCGPHPEFSADIVRNDAKCTDRMQLLEQSEDFRWDYNRALCRKMGMNVSDSSTIPTLSRLFLTSSSPASLPPLIAKLRDECGKDNDLVGNNDTFRLCQPNKFDPATEEESVPLAPTDDLNKVVKYVDVYTEGYPEHKLTPHFSLPKYYEVLAHEREKVGNSLGELGSVVMYGEVVTSTNTMLDRNFNILKHLPTGFITVGTIQIAGRGRGNNVWVNPTGVLAVSGVLKLPIMQDPEISPIVFVQYLVSIAMVEAIKDYGAGYSELPIRLKWPNDLYALNPSVQGIDVGQQGDNDYLKIGGVLVTTNIINGQYALVFGCGTNISNKAPTTSLNLLLKALNIIRKGKGKEELAPIVPEVLLAKFMVKLEDMLFTFRFQGFSAVEELYYSYWLHSDQIVTLEQYSTKAIVRGITLNDGMLKVEELDSTGRPNGRMIELQPDGNSFDMFKGLLKKKE